MFRYYDGTLYPGCSTCMDNLAIGMYSRIVLLQVVIWFKSGRNLYFVFTCRRVANHAEIYISLSNHSLTAVAVPPLLRDLSSCR